MTRVSEIHGLNSANETVKVLASSEGNLSKKFDKMCGRADLPYPALCLVTIIDNKRQIIRDIKYK